MDKRERMNAVIAGEKVDRLPCGFWHHFDAKDAFGVASVHAHIQYYNETDADVLKVMNEHMYLIEQQISCAEDWKKVKPVPFERTNYPDYIEEFRAIRREIPAEVPLWVTIHGALVSAYHATDKPGNFSNPDNLVSRHLRENPEAVAVALMAVAETLSDLCDRLIDAGADGIYYAALGSEEYRFSRELLEKYVIPADRYVMDRVRDKGALSILHICKDKVQLPAYTTVNADVYNWAVHECPYSLADGRRLFPGKTLLGGFDDRDGELVHGDEAAIRAKAEGIIRTAGRERLIVGADCTLPDDVELWRVHAAMKAVSSL